MQLSVIGKCPLFEKTRISPSVDAQYTFCLKSLYYCYVAEKHTAPKKLNNLAARSLQNQFVTNSHEAYVLMWYKIEEINLVWVWDDHIDSWLMHGTGLMDVVRLESLCETQKLVIFLWRPKSFAIYFKKYKNLNILQLKSMSVKS